MTGRFPIPSLRGAEYIMVMKCLTPVFRDCGIVHEAIRTDNETSGNLKEALRKLNLRPEYRQNPAERDIRTFKNHFIATLCTTDQDFPSASGTCYSR
jgi:hypothetical protein